MAAITDLRSGMAVELDGVLYTVVEYQHVKPGKGGAFVRTRLKNVSTGAVIDRTFRASDEIHPVHMEEKKCQFLYRDGDLFHFMDSGSFEEFLLNKDVMGETAGFLAENQDASVLIARGQTVSVRVPIFVVLKVTKTDPGLRGDTATGGSKPATLETGVTVQVPLFISPGDKLRIDTRTGEYVERAS